MNSQELKKEIEKVELQIKDILSNIAFRDFLAKINFLHGAIDAMKPLHDKLVIEEQAQVKKVEEDVNKTN